MCRDRRRLVNEGYRSLRANVHGTSTEILSTVDRVIARISALDCDGRDWASPREAVPSRVAHAPTALLSPPRARRRSSRLPPPAPHFAQSHARRAPSLSPSPFLARARYIPLSPTRGVALYPVSSKVSPSDRFANVPCRHEPTRTPRTRTILLRASFARRVTAGSEPFGFNLSAGRESFCWIRFVTRRHSPGIRTHCRRARGTLPPPTRNPFALLPVRVDWSDFSTSENVL